VAAKINVTVNSNFAQAQKDLDDFGTETKEVTQEIEQFRAAFNPKEIDQFIDRNKRAAAAVKATSGSLKGAQAEQKALRKQIQSLIRNGIDPQSASIGKLRDRYNQLDDQILKAKDAQKKYQQEQKKTTANSRKFNQTATVSIKNLAGIAAGFVSIAAATAFIGSSTTDFVDYSKQIANVNTLIDITDEQFQRLDGSITELSEDFAIQKKELSAGVYQSLSAGAGSLAEAIDVVTESSVLAKGALIENAQAVDIVTTALNAYGPEAQSAADITDDYFTIVKQGKITGEELSQTIGKSISLFAAAQLPLEDLGAGIATLTKVGVPAAEATTQLNGIVNAFLKPTEDLTKAINEYGFASGSALLESEGLGGALEFIQQASNGSLEEIAKLVPNIRGLRGALAAGAEDGAVYNDILKEFENNSGAATTALEKQTSGFASQAFRLEQAQIKFENLRIEIGSRVLPALVSFVEIVGKAVPVLAGLTAGVITFLAISKGAAVIQGLAVAFKALNVAVAANPIGAIAAIIITILIPAIILLVKNWDFVVVQITTTLSKLKEIFKLIGASISAAWITAFNSVKVVVLELAGIILEKLLGGVNKFLDLAAKLPFVGEKFADLQENVNGFAGEIEAARLESIASSEAAIAAAAANKQAVKEQTASNIAEIERERIARLAALEEQKRLNAEVAAGLGGDGGGDSPEEQAAENFTKIQALKLAAVRAANEKIFNSASALTQQLRAIWKDTVEFLKENWFDYTSSIVNGTTNLLSALDNLNQVRLENDLAAIDARLQAELEANGLLEESTMERLERELAAAFKAGDTALIKEKQDAIERAKIVERFEKEKAQAEYKAALASWRISLATSIAQGALAVARTLASVPFPLNIPLAALQGTASGLQIAAVAASKPQPPAFAEGGSFETNGPMPIMVGDNVGGRERVTVEPTSSTGFNSSGLSGSDEKQPVILQVGDEQLEGWLIRGFREGRLPVDERAVVAS